MLSEPRPEYHGIKIQETFGNSHCPSPAACSACVTSARRFAVQRLHDSHRHRNLAVAHAKHCETRQAVAEFLAGHRAVAAVTTLACPATSTTPLARKYAPKGAGRVFHLQPQGGYDAGVNLVSNLKLFRASGQCRRHPLAGDPSGHRPRTASSTTPRRSNRAPRLMCAGCRSAIEDKEDLIADPRSGAERLKQRAKHNVTHAAHAVRSPALRHTVPRAGACHRGGAFAPPRWLDDISPSESVMLAQQTRKPAMLRAMTLLLLTVRHQTRRWLRTAATAFQIRSRL